MEFTLLTLLANLLVHLTNSVQLPPGIAFNLSKAVVSVATISFKAVVDVLLPQYSVDCLKAS